MGSRSSGGRVGPSNVSSKLKQNFTKLKAKYPLSPEGFFGTKGTGKVRVISSSNAMKTAKDFWARLSSGGKIFEAGSGVQGVKFSDGSQAYLRIKTSSKGSPAIHISVSSKHTGIKHNQKIHFVMTKKVSGS
jgi:hypothetical protein